LIAIAAGHAPAYAQQSAAPPAAAPAAATPAATAASASDDLPPLSPVIADPAGELDPDAPLPDLPDATGASGWGVSWPDLSTPLPPLPDLPPEQDVTAFQALPGADAVADLPDPVASPGANGNGGSDVVAVGTSDTPAEVASADMRRYDVQLEGFGDVADAAFRARFNGLSVLVDNNDEPANGAQLNRRIQEDTALLDQMLRNAGYYDSALSSEVRRDGERLVVVFNGVPGPRYSYSAINLNGLQAAGADEAERLTPFYARGKGDPLAVGDPAVADDIIAAQAGLQYEMRETGYPFGEVGAELLTVDHDTRKAVLDQAVTPGARLRFGQVVADDEGMLGARHIQRIARFHPGEWYQWSDTDDLRRALIATGLVASVNIEPVANPDGQTVDMNVAIRPAPPRTIAGQLGYSSGQGFRAEVSWEHRNLFPPEGALILRGVAGTREQLGSVTFRRNNWLRRDRILTVQALGSNVQTDAFDARTIHLTAQVERATTLIYQKKWSWAFGVEVLGTDENAYSPQDNADVGRRYLIGSVFGLVSYDRSNDLLDPTRGFRLTARIAPEASFHDEVFAYVRTQFDATGYWPVGERVVLAGRARLGAIFNANVNDIAPSRRLYSGGGGSVRGYGYQRIGPLAPDNDPIGGVGLFELAAEARIKAFGAFSVVPFVDAGNVYQDSIPGWSDITDLRVGAGVGIRYATNFGPIRFDVGTPLNRRPGDSRIAVYVSLGQAF
jgi:translocation and assembly module TamA